MINPLVTKKKLKLIKIVQDPSEKPKILITVVIKMYCFRNSHNINIFCPNIKKGFAHLILLK